MGSSCSTSMTLFGLSSSMMVPQEGSSPSTPHTESSTSSLGLSPEEIRKLERRAAAEVKKVLSFKVPVQRVSFCGFKAGLTLLPNTKPPEEIHLELLASYLPQHLLFNMKQVYLSSSSVPSIFNPLGERRTAVVTPPHSQAESRDYHDMSRYHNHNHQHHYHNSNFETLINHYHADHHQNLHLPTNPQNYPQNSHVNSQIPNLNDHMPTLPHSIDPHKHHQHTPFHQNHPTIHHVPIQIINHQQQQYQQVAHHPSHQETPHQPKEPATIQQKAPQKMRHHSSHSFKQVEPCKVLDEHSGLENESLSEFSHDEACILLVKIKGIHDLVDSFTLCEPQLDSNKKLYESTDVTSQERKMSQSIRGATSSNDTSSSLNSARHSNNDIHSSSQHRPNLQQRNPSLNFSDAHSKQMHQVCTSISNIYTVFISIIYSLGGDVERFDPEELLCQFHSPQVDATRSISDSLLSAIQCGLKIQQTDLSKTFKSLQNRKIELRCVVTFGSVRAFHVGGHKNHWIRLFTGSAFHDAYEKINQCKAGQVVLTRPVYERVKQRVLTIGDKELPIKGVVIADTVKKEVIASGVQNITFHASFGRIIKQFIPTFVAKNTAHEKLEHNKHEKNVLVCSMKIGHKYLSSDDSELQLKGRNELINLLQHVLEKYEQIGLCKIFEDIQQTIVVSFSIAIAKLSVGEILFVFELLVEISQHVDTIGIGMSLGPCLCMTNFGSDIRRDFGMFGQVANISLQLMRESFSHHEGYILCEEKVAETVFQHFEKEALNFNNKRCVKIMKSVRMDDCPTSTTGEKVDQISITFSNCPPRLDSTFTTNVNLFFEEVDAIIVQLTSINKNDILPRDETNKVIVIKIMDKWKNKVVCLTNSSKQLFSAKPCSLFIENLKMIITEFFLRQLRIELDYTCFESVYSSLSSEQKQQIVTTIFKKSDDTDFESLSKYFNLLNPILGLHFSASENEDILDSTINIRKTSQIVCKLLLKGWKQLGYATREPWLLFCDDIHLYDHYSRGVLEYLFKFSHVEGMGYGLLFVTMNLTPESHNDNVDMMELQSIHSNDEDLLRELQQWCEVSTLHLELSSLSKDLYEGCILEMIAKLNHLSNKKCQGVEMHLLQLIFEKSQNPLSISLLLKFLNDMNCLRINEENMIELFGTLDHLKIPRTRADFYLHQFQRLDNEQQLILRVAVLYGRYFDLKMIIKGVACLDSNLTPEKITTAFSKLAFQHGILEVVEQLHFQQCKNRHEEAFYTFSNSELYEYIKNEL
nr:unnamed protein product [Naegleria fowleri]